MNIFGKIGVVFIVLIPSSLFAQTKNIANENTVNTQPISIPQAEIYNISINNDWKATSLVKFDENNIYIPIKFLPNNLTSLIKDDKKSKNLTVPRTLITKLDSDKLLLDISLDGEFFNSVIIPTSNNGRDNSLQSTPINAGLVNYTLNAPLDELDKVKGSFNFKWSSKDNWNLSNSSAWNGEKSVRVNSFFQRKFDNNDILTIGDTSNNAISGLNSVNFAGVRLASDFYNELDNDKNTPILPISGFSVNPSKLDLYMNNQIIEKTEINSGKYELQHLLRQNGFGLAQAYVYDLAGTPTIISIPFYGSSDIIREGTDAYDISAGMIRKDMGIQSFSYSNFIVNALYKKGITKNYTQDVFLQYTKDFQVASTIAHWVPYPKLGKLGLGFTMNSQQQKNYYLSWDRSVKDFSFNFNTQRSSLFCTGLEQSCFKDKTQLSVISHLPKNYGQLSLNYLHRTLEKYNDKTINATWRKALSKTVTLNTSISKNYANSQEKKESSISAYIGLSIALGRVQSNSNLNKGKDKTSFSQTLSLSEDKNNPHYGYGAIGFDNNSGNNFTANYYANLDNFSYNVYGNKDEQQQKFYGSISGAAVYVPEYNSLTFNQPINDRFTFVKVNGANEEIPLSRNSKNVKTNKSGNKVLTDSNLDSQEKVVINVNQLPRKLSAEIVEKNYHIPFAYGNKVELSVKAFPRNVTISGIEEGTLFNIGKEQFVVGKNGRASIDVNGKSTFNLPNGKTCEITFKEDVKKYDCNQ